MDDFIYFFISKDNPESDVSPNKIIECFPWLKKIISRKLIEIFQTAQNTKDEKILHELQSRLREALKRLRPRYKSSPSGNHHLMLINGNYILVNIYGIYYLFTNMLFYDGELEISNYHWIEKDNLVILDIHYIVHDLVQKCICHFDRNDYFVYLTESKKTIDIPVSEILAPPNPWDTESWSTPLSSNSDDLW